MQRGCCDLNIVHRHCDPEEVAIMTHDEIHLYSGNTLHICLLFSTARHLETTNNIVLYCPVFFIVY